MRKILGALAIAVAVMLSASAQTSNAVAQGSLGSVTNHGRSGGVSIDIPINKSDVLRSPRPFFEVAVGNPAIADVQVLGERSLYVFGRSFGSTSVTLTDEDGRIISVVDINITQDIARLKLMLHALLPNEQIAVRAAHDGIVLSGSVSDAASASSAVALAQRFAPDNVSNLLTVRGSQQVMLAVKFVEMRRDTIKRLGVNATGSIGSGALSLFGDIVNTAISPPSIAQFGLNIGSGGNSFEALLDLLEEKGAVRTLAEPTLVAMSGDTADFLAGGEFPIPVGAQDGAVEIEFKKFGVGLSFTPTVVRHDLINIDLFMEVSEPDETSDFELIGVRVPGLVVRRATTTVELRNAESFAIAGLLRENFSDQIKQLPFIGDVPIIGALTRSTEFQTGQSELVMIVTPYLVRPSDQDSLRTPDFVAPSERELFWDGVLEKDANLAPGMDGATGLSGLHGFSTW